MSLNAKRVKAGGAPPEVPQEPEYDVAISFLGKDQRIAGDVAERLAESLKVFYYPRSQEQLAGTDGMESMRVPFVSGARVVVVLYREPWGETEWTRLEESANQRWMLEAWMVHAHVRAARQNEQAACVAASHTCSVRA
jgi:hypothetical protein